MEAKLNLLSVVVIADAQGTRKAAEVGTEKRHVFSIGGFGRRGEFNERIDVEAEVVRLNSESRLAPIYPLTRVP